MLEAIIVAHFVGDWLLQSRYIAQTKSERIESLAEHLFFYGLAIGFVGWQFWGENALWWVTLNMVLHGLWDWHYYRIGKKYLGSKGVTAENYTEKKMFWDSIAIDQTFHLVTLAATMRLM